MASNNESEITVTNVREFSTLCDSTDGSFTFPTVPGDSDTPVTAKWKVMYTKDGKTCVLSGAGYEFTPGSTVGRSAVEAALKAATETYGGSDPRFFIEHSSDQNAVIVVHTVEGSKPDKSNGQYVGTDQYIRDIDLSDVEDGTEVTVSVVGGGSAGLIGKPTYTMAWPSHGGGAGGLASFSFLKSDDMSHVYVLVGWGSTPETVGAQGFESFATKTSQSYYTRSENPSEWIVLKNTPSSNQLVGAKGFPTVVWVGGADDNPVDNKTEDGMYPTPVACAFGGEAASLIEYEKWYYYVNGSKRDGMNAWLPYRISDTGGIVYPGEDSYGYCTISRGAGYYHYKAKGGSATVNSSDSRYFRRSTCDGECGGVGYSLGFRKLVNGSFTYDDNDWAVYESCEYGDGGRLVIPDTLPSEYVQYSTAYRLYKMPVTPEYVPSTGSGAGLKNDNVSVYGGGASALNTIISNPVPNTTFKDGAGNVYAESYHTDYINNSVIYLISYGGGSNGKTSYSQVVDNLTMRYGGGGAAVIGKDSDSRTQSSGGDGVVVIQYVHKPTEEAD